MSTATLRYTSSVEATARRQHGATLRAMGRVIRAAQNAPRVEARRAALRASAAAFVAECREAGATEVGFKVCDDMGKYRFTLALDDAQAYLSRERRETDVEAWAVLERLDGPVW